MTTPGDIEEQRLRELRLIDWIFGPPGKCQVRQVCQLRQAPWAARAEYVVWLTIEPVDEVEGLASHRFQVCAACTAALRADPDSVVACVTTLERR